MLECRGMKLLFAFLALLLLACSDPPPAPTSATPDEPRYQKWADPTSEDAEVEVLPE